jgi:hypothetical protein
VVRVPPYKPPILSHLKGCRKDRPGPLLGAIDGARELALSRAHRNVSDVLSHHEGGCSTRSVPHLQNNLPPCAKLTATETLYPGTKLRLVFRVQGY